LEKLTGQEKYLIGMVHVRALPGTPRGSLPVREICRIAFDEARQLEEAGFDALLVENMHDTPYLKRAVGPEITAAMTEVTAAVREAVECPVGVQILAGANREAIAVAHATGARFVRVEGLVFGHLADEGLIESDAGVLLRYRRAIGAEKVKILADIKKKHSSHAITADVNLSDTAQAAEFFGADGLIITGSSTGRPARAGDLEEARRGTGLPLIVGSGTTPGTLAELWPLAQGFIVGSYLKKDGRWENELDPGRIQKLIEQSRKLRESSRSTPPEL